MARLPRLYRVVATWPDGTRKRRNYLTPKAAEERRELWANGRDNGEGVPPLEPAAEVTVTPSYPVAFPSMESDTFDIPDGVLSRSAWHDLAARLGIKPEAVRSISVSRDVLTVEYDPTPGTPGKSEPRQWRVQIEES